MSKKNMSKRAENKDFQEKKPKNTEKKLRFVSVENMKKQFGKKIEKKPEKKKSPEPSKNQKTEELKDSSTSELNYSTRHLEQLRFTVALKTMVRDKMKAKLSDDIPAVCTCGAMNKMRNLRNPIQCANNCPFYNRQQEYQRALSEMNQSFKASQ